MLLDLNKLRGHPKELKAHNEYIIISEEREGHLWGDVFHGAAIAEIISKNILYFLPSAYSQKHGSNSRQQYYNDIFVNHRYPMANSFFTLSKEPKNPYDKYAIGIHFMPYTFDGGLHLGYIPQPLNILVSELMSKHQGDIRLRHIYNIKLHDKYIAPIFRWELELPEELNSTIQNRFTALLLEDD